MATVPLGTQQQWRAWTDANVAKPFRKRALKAALKSLASGATAEQAIAAAKKAELDRANYLALSALVLGAITFASAFFLGGLAILATLFTVASAVQGRHSVQRAWMAWTGLALALAGIGLWVVLVAIKLAAG